MASHVRRRSGLQALTITSIMKETKKSFCSISFSSGEWALCEQVRQTMDAYRLMAINLDLLLSPGKPAEAGEGVDTI